MSTLKNLAVLKTIVNKKPSVNFEDGKDRISIYQDGYGAAINANGHKTIFANCLKDLYQKLQRKVAEDEELQERLREPHYVEKNKLLGEINAKKTLIEIKEEKILQYNRDIEEIKFEMNEAKLNPQKYGLDVNRRPRAQFYIGLIILLVLTLYVTVFYISASYSSFFKSFEHQDTQLLAVIFDGQALNKAKADGLLELIFVTTIPFVFMGLGYLIHMFSKTGKHDLKSRLVQFAKIFLLLAVTFVFDGILAFLIEQKIYNFEKTALSPPFNLAIAVTKIEFWSIIFAGFVVYVIWGLVFDFVMKEWEGIDSINALVRKLERKISDIKELIQKNNDIIGTAKLQEIELSNKLAKVNGQIEMVSIPMSEYLHWHTEFVKGWMMAVSKEIALAIKEKNELIAVTHKLANEHLSQLNFEIKDIENISYEIENN